VPDGPTWRDKERRREERDEREARLYAARGGRGCAGGGERRIALYFLICAPFALLVIVGVSVSTCGQ